MKKLSIERLEEMVIERNEKGLTATVEVMNREELAAYKNNCLEAIERLEIRKAKQKKIGGVMQATQNEIIEELRGFIAYIDSVLAEKEETNVIDTFLANWKEQSVALFTEVQKGYSECANARERAHFFGGRYHKQIVDIIMKYGRYENFSEIINQLMDAEVERKKAALLAKIEAKAGNIIDASGLYIASNLDINGKIIGDNATVTVKTITAGGYNIQSLHYRVLVK